MFAYSIYLLANEFIKVTFCAHKFVSIGRMLCGVFPEIAQLSAFQPNNWSITYEDKPSVLIHSSPGNSLIKAGRVHLEDNSSPVFNLSELPVNGCFACSVRIIPHFSSSYIFIFLGKKIEGGWGDG